MAPSARLRLDNPRTTIPGGEIVARWGQSMLPVRGGEIAGKTRTMTTMTHKRTSASSTTVAAAAGAAMTAIAHCPTAGGVVMTTGGPGDEDGDVEAPAVRVTDC